MKTHLVLAFALLICTAANVATAQQLITPINAGLVHSPIVVVNNNPGDQTDPRISGDLVTYTDYTLGGGRIRYFNVLTGADTIIPADIYGTIDTLSSVDGTRIVFSRLLQNRTATFLYDTATSSLTEIDPQPAGSLRFSTAIGGSRVAIIDVGDVGTPDVLVHDLLTHTTHNLSANSETAEQSPNVAPDGNTVVWDSCNLTLTICEVHAAFWQSPAWNVASVSKKVCNPDVPQACIPIPRGLAVNGDTDGSWIAYQYSVETSVSQILFQPIGGDSIERQLLLTGYSRNPSIDHGVIAFEIKESPATATDLFVYHIATNRLYQVTDTPIFDESLSDVTVLPNGDIRVAWAVNDAVGGAQNIYATTFTPTSSGVHYTYRGNPFTSFSCGPDPYGFEVCSTPAPTNPYTSYTAGHFVLATLTLDDPLPANLTFQEDITLRPGYRLTITDGIQTLTYALGDDASADNVVAGVATDANGRITDWDLGLGSSALGTWVESSRSAGPTISARDVAMLSIGQAPTPADLAYSDSAPGTWTVTGSGPETAVRSLISLLSPALGLRRGQINSLTDKLNNVLDSINQGLYGQAIKQMTAFINEIEAAVAARTMSGETAAALLAAATDIISALRTQ